MGQIFESVVPYLIYKRRKKEIQNKASSKEAPEGIELLTPGGGIDEDIRLHAEIEAAKDEFTVSFQLPVCALCDISMLVTYTCGIMTYLGVSQNCYV